MEGHRAGLILASARFDAYGTLREYARRPRDRYAVAAMDMLRRRTLVACMAEASSRARSMEDMERLLELTLGKGLSGTAGTPSLEGKTDAELMDMYTSALKSSGAAFDPEALLEARRRAGLSPEGENG